MLLWLLFDFLLLRHISYFMMLIVAIADAAITLIFFRWMPRHFCWLLQRLRLAR